MIWVQTFIYFVSLGIVRIPLSLVVVKFASLMKYENTSWPQTLLDMKK